MRKLRLLLAFLRLRLPGWLLRLYYTGRLPVIDGRRIDPQAMAASDLVEMVRDPDAMPDVQESRRQLASMAAKFDLPCPATVVRRDLELPGADGPCAAREYLPAGLGGEGAIPTLLYLHGGGWVQGDLDSHDGLCGKLADWAGIRVISFAYRLAPEDPFPAGPDDVLACYRALVSGDAGLSIDPRRFAVGGDSAGANLTACLMHDLGEAGEGLPAAQLLIYPAVDARMDTQSMRDLADQPLLPVSRINWFLDLYLPKGQDRLDPRISPLFSPHLAGQPAAMIVAGGHDPLWDDGLAYAKHLEEAGVAVTLETYPGQIHAFVSLTGVIDEGNDALRKSALWLKRVLGA